MNPTRSEQEIVGGIIAIAPGALAAWWLFTRIARYQPRREARAAAVAFGLSSPFAILISLPIGTLVGSYTAYLGAPMGLAGAAAAMVATMTALAYLAARVGIARARRAALTPGTLDPR